MPAGSQGRKRSGFPTERAGSPTKGPTGCDGRRDERGGSGRGREKYVLVLGCFEDPVVGRTKHGLRRRKEVREADPRLERRLVLG